MLIVGSRLTKQEAHLHDQSQSLEQYCNTLGGPQEDLTRRYIIEAFMVG